PGVDRTDLPERGSAGISDREAAVDPYLLGRDPEPRPLNVFRQLLVSALVSGVMSSFLWFAVTFWTYLETGSVLATSVIGGSFALFSAFVGVLFGTFVDRHRKY